MWLQVLESAMSLPGVRSWAAPEQAARLAKRGCLPSLHERASIFLLLADVITQQGRPGAAAEATQVHARGKLEVWLRACALHSTNSNHAMHAHAHRCCTRLCVSLLAHARRCAWWWRTARQPSQAGTWTAPWRACSACRSTVRTTAARAWPWRRST
jgi:hypothetical protein